MVMGEGDSQAFMGAGNDVYVQCASWSSRSRACMPRFVVSSVVVRMEYNGWWYSSASYSAVVWVWLAGLGRVSRVDVLGLARKPIYSWWW